MNQIPRGQIMTKLQPVSLTSSRLTGCQLVATASMRSRGTCASPPVLQGDRARLGELGTVSFRSGVEVGDQRANSPIPPVAASHLRLGVRSRHESHYRQFPADPSVPHLHLRNAPT